jgi:hypothetical protein
MKRIVPLGREAFYDAHMKTRRVIENAWGLYKTRFQCAKRVLRFKNPARSAQCLKSCAILHNFFIILRDHWDYEAEEAPDDVNFDQNILVENVQQRLNAIFDLFQQVNNL